MKHTVSLLALTLSVSLPVLAQTAEKPAKKPKAATAAKTTAPAGIAHVRFLHAATGAGNVDIYAREDEKIKTGFSYRSLTDYTDIKSGKLPLKITATGKTDALLSGAVTLARDKYYTVATYMDGATPAVIAINESTGVEMPDKARVRVVNLVSGSDGVAVTKPSTRAADGTANFLTKPVLFGKSASKTLKPATETLQFRDSAGKMLKEMPDIKMEAAVRYTAFVVGKTGGTGADAVDVIVKDAGK